MKIGSKVKETLLKKIAQNPDISLRQLAKENNVGYSTLCHWRWEMNQTKATLSAERLPKGEWSSQKKFVAVVATQGMNEYEKGEYCRHHGIYAEHLAEWEKACLLANADSGRVSSEVREDLKDQVHRIRELERELARKEKALAETAALLVLRKKAEAIWGGNEAD